MPRGAVLLMILLVPALARSADVPRPEHPRPNAVRAHWATLNGPWQFRFDPADEGLAGNWFDPAAEGFDRTINVPFPWESELSGIHDTSGESKIGWYRRTLTVPADFPAEDRVWLRFDAVDWLADVWLNGAKIATHEGGYTPFEIDITDSIQRDGENTLVVRAFDETNPSLPTGKQVGWYTPTSGIWQTVWLESRPAAHIDRFTIRTTIDPPAAEFLVETAGTVGDYSVSVRSGNEMFDPASALLKQPRIGGEKAGMGRASLTASVADPKLWTPETPYLYPITLELKKGDQVVDQITSYFGLRTIGRGKLPGEDFERVLLNGKPIYLRGALDQSFNPKGLYTAPSDEYLKRDIQLAKLAGFNFLRIHIKSEEPRRLYHADSLGMLIMEDMPCTWRQNDEARRSYELTMRDTIRRDINHPSIFSWVAFNETWGLRDRDTDYMTDKDTQDWVRQVVAEIREIDPTRLVEDNSPCNYDHLSVTDLNSWHFYIDDHASAARHIAEVVEKSFPGSTFNYCPGDSMNSAPLINSEYGSVSAGGGDRDISWGFRDLTTQLRKHDKIQGYVYTELSDIEWEHNGIYNYDRSPKLFGYDQWLPDMWVSELQQADFVGYDTPPVIVARPGETIEVPVFISHYSDREGPVKLRWWIQGWDDRGNIMTVAAPRTIDATWEPYRVTWQEPLRVKMPDYPFVGALALTLRDPNHPPGQIDPRFAVNFVNIVVRSDEPLPAVKRRNDHEAVLRFAPDDFARSEWSEPMPEVPGEAGGLGAGTLEYRIKVPPAVVDAGITHFTLRFEAAARAGRKRVDWPERKNRQDNPQTDGKPWAGDALDPVADFRGLLDRLREPGRPTPTRLEVRLGDTLLGTETLDDDPADARGVLSHLNGVRHGSFGELLEFAEPISEALLTDLKAGKPLVLRLTVPEGANSAGGLSLFGASTGMFPIDPTLELTTANPLPADLGVDPTAPVAIDRIVQRITPLLNSGEKRDAEPATWAYTTSDPGEGWRDPDFDDSAWERGPAGFGTQGTPAVRVNTRWDQPRIWLRTTVELPELGKSDQLTLRLFHDEDAQIFVNGKPLHRASGFVSSYEDIRLTSEQKDLFRPGKNTIAVSCRQTAGGQGIDLGLLRLSPVTE